MGNPTIVSPALDADIVVDEVRDQVLHSAKFAVPENAQQDIWRALLRWKLWLSLAWHGLRQRYKRSWIGVGWIAVSFALFTGIKLVIFGALTDKPLSFFGPYLAIGYLSFRFISNSITGGSAAFISSQNWIKAEPMPLMVYIFKLLANNMMISLIQIVPALLICFAFMVPNIAVVWCLPFILFAFVLNGVSVSVIVGVLCARHRDFLYLLTTLMQLLYFATPILWVPPETGIRASLAVWNPLAHFIAIVRQPMIDGTIPWQSWAVVGGITGFTLVASFITFAVARRRIVFWL